MKFLLIGLLTLGSICSFASVKYSQVSKCKVLRSEVATITLYKHFNLSNDAEPSLVLFNMKNGDSKIYSADVQLTHPRIPILTVSAEIIDFSIEGDLHITINHTKNRTNGKMSMNNKELNLRCKPMNQ